MEKGVSSHLCNVKVTIFPLQDCASCRTSKAPSQGSGRWLCRLHLIQGMDNSSNLAHPPLASHGLNPPDASTQRGCLFLMLTKVSGGITVPHPSPCKIKLLTVILFYDIVYQLVIMMINFHMSLKGNCHMHTLSDDY